MKTNTEFTPSTTATSEQAETADAKYWREKYEVSTRHLMVAVKEWGKLRQQVEEYRSSKAA